jgi:nucleoside-diphosphate-sugar epimerase
MRVLLIGGNGFIGRFVAAALEREGHAVAVFHRGSTPASAGVDEILGDRNQLSARAEELRRFAPEVLIDLVMSSGVQALENRVFFDAAYSLVK